MTGRFLMIYWLKVFFIILSESRQCGGHVLELQPLKKLPRFMSVSLNNSLVFCQKYPMSLRKQ